MSASNESNDKVDKVAHPSSSIPATSRDTPGIHNNFNFPFRIQPGHIFFGTAVPLCLGAYLGFTRQMNIYKKEAAAEAAAEAMNASVTNIVTTEGKIMAGRALAVATMSSVGGFALMGAAVFYGSGFQSVDEASQAFTSWGQRKRRQIEAASIDLGVDDHPDAIAVKNMSEEEEMEYFQTKYMRDIEKRVSVWSWERARADEMNAASDDRMNEID